MGRARIHEPAGRKRADDARHANFARERVDPDLDEFRAHGVHHLVAMRPAGHRALAGIETLDGIGLQAMRNEFGVFLDRADARAA